ncbi:MAG TPA: hypothetical protein VFX78_13355 [Candidatus Eisenbacteria bacterium]|nr:hypothetical protein [Candidatus Eisenbacteria bacterium]
MTAKLTITLSPDVLKALKHSKTITVAVDSGRRFGPASRAASAGKANGSSGPYREGSLPAKLLTWAKGRKAFGVPDVMKAMKIKRGHASMLLAYVGKSGAVKRVGRGEYAAT